MNTWMFRGEERNIGEMSVFFKNGVDENTFRVRVKRGWDIEKAVSEPVKEYNKKYEYKGGEYRIADLKHFFAKNVTPYQFGLRVAKGWSVELAVDTPIQDVHCRGARKTFCYHGKELYYPELAKYMANGVSQSIFWNRIGQGWTVEDAVETRVQKANRKTFAFNGEQYTIRQLYKKLDAKCGLDVFTRRLLDGLPYEVAADKQERTGLNRYEYKGQMYTAKQLEQFSGASTAQIKNRLSNGWSVEDAVEIPLGKHRTPHQKQKPDVCEYAFGVDFDEAFFDGITENTESVFNFDF